MAEASHSGDAPEGDGPGLAPGAPSAFMAAVGLVVTSVDADGVEGWIDLGPEHHQPGGIVHGGVYTSAVETAASIGAFTAAAPAGMVAVGVHNSTDFLRQMTAGRVNVVARPIQQGRTQQLWEVRITDPDDRLVAIGQVRLANITPRP
jgi:1,4-dihydroxy-2-naphthoyl-CoA hydrolase